MNTCKLLSVIADRKLLDGQIITFGSQFIQVDSNGVSLGDRGNGTFMEFKDLAWNTLENYRLRSASMSICNDSPQYNHLIAFQRRVFKTLSIYDLHSMQKIYSSTIPWKKAYTEPIAVKFRGTKLLFQYVKSSQHCTKYTIFDFECQKKTFKYQAPQAFRQADFSDNQVRLDNY